MPKGVRLPQSERYQVGNLSQRHRAVLEWMMANPFATLKEVARGTGHTPAWIYQLINTDLFQEELAKRNEQAYGTYIIPLRAKLMGVTDMALDKLAEKVESSQDGAFILNTADKMLGRLGHGPSAGVTVNTDEANLYVVDNETLSRARDSMNKVREQNTEREVHAALPAPE